jgi:hypothetical protein
VGNEAIVFLVYLYLNVGVGLIVVSYSLILCSELWLHIVDL